MTTEEIRELINLVNESGVAELEVQRGENRVRIRRTTRGPQAGFLTPENPHPATPHEPPSPPSPPPVVAANAGVPPQPKAPAEAEQHLVTSPIVGTFYESSSPESPPFVRIGETVQPGTVLCIIESMKLMNEIEAELAGVVESKLVANGQAVEYGEALFGIRPL
jgi:acetyl-CoA carboxylase biotin carboxyl carrier protein